MCLIYENKHAFMDMIYNKNNSQNINDESGT